MLKAEQLTKTYGSVTSVDQVDLTIERGEFLAILGRSGSGKSTLLSLLAGLESPDRGEITFFDQSITSLTEDELALWRRDNIGLVFQSFNLIPTLSALENVCFPLYPEKNISVDQRRKKAQTCLEQVGLSHRSDHRPGQLSGGEQQRVAIARSLVNDASMILADEPTGNLDSKTGDEILQLFQRLQRENNVTLVVVTHDEAHVAAAADRIIRMEDGRVIDEWTNAKAN
ncbi:ABC transporter ATP-binding protein [Desmospora profundinema]|nr:ABC transporter ATP-binding protein [Desmospora profundinema]